MKTLLSKKSFYAAALLVLLASGTAIHAAEIGIRHKLSDALKEKTLDEQTSLVFRILKTFKNTIWPGLRKDLTTLGPHAKKALGMLKTIKGLGTQNIPVVNIDK